MVFIKDVSSNNDTGTSSRWGGNDINYLDDYFDNVDITPKVAKINTRTYFRSGKFEFRNPADTFSYIVVAGAITANRNLNLPVLTSDATLATTSDLALEIVSYTIYIEDGIYKAKNAATGIVDFTNSSSDVGALLASVVDSVSDTTPLSIEVGPGEFIIKNWDGSKFDHHNITIKGQGMGVTVFTVHNDTGAVNGHNGVFKFSVAGDEFTSIALAANTAIDDYAVLTNSTTDLTNGCHVVIGSTTDLPLSGNDIGEHNRIVKIVATGGSPSQRIILEKPIKNVYTTAASAFIRKVDFLENINLSDFTIKSNQDLTVNVAWMRMDFCYNVHVRNVHFLDWGVWNGGAFHNGLVNMSVVDSTFEDLVFEQSPERGHSTGQNAVGYAISCRCATESVYYQNIHFKGLIRHCFTTTGSAEAAKNGEPKNIWIINNTANTTDEATFDTHGEGDGIYFVNCSVYSSRSGGGSDSAAGTSDTDAFNTRCRNTHFINCKVQNCRGTGFSCDAGLTGIVFDNCAVNGLTLGRLGISCGASFAAIRNCHIQNVDKEGILIGSSTSNVQISNCSVKNVCRTDNTKPAVDLGATNTNIQVNGLIIDTSNDSAIVPIKTGSGCSDITLDNVQLIGAGTDPSFSGVNIRWNPLTCIGRKISRYPYKIGRVEGNGGSNSCTGLWEGQTSDVNGNKRIETTDGTFREYAIATLNTVAGIKSNTYTERDNNPYIRLVFRLEQTTGLRFFFGWNSDDTAVGPTGADPLANKSGFMIMLNTATDSNIKIYHNSGDATTTIGATIQAVDTNKHVIELRSDGAGNFQYRWDYGTWTTVSTDIPAATTDLAMQCYVDNNDSGVTKTLNMIEIYTEVDQK